MAILVGGYPLGLCLMMRVVEQFTIKDARRMKIMKYGICVVPIVVLLCLLGLSGCASIETSRIDNQDRLEAQWGIRLTRMSLTAGENLLDCRYLVSDPQKASALFKTEESTPHLIDQASGAVLRIPEMSKIGALHTSMKNVAEGKVYFMMFANPGRLVKKGGKISLVINDLTAANFTVE